MRIPPITRTDTACDGCSVEGLPVVNSPMNTSPGCMACVVWLCEGCLNKMWMILNSPESWPAEYEQT